MTKSTPRVFLSYSYGDERSRQIVDVLRRMLDERGVAVWDDRMIEPGADWAQVIDEALCRAEAFVLLIPPESERSPRLYFDIGAAASRAAETPGQVRLIPILVHGAGRSELPRRLLRWSGLDAGDLPPQEVAQEISRVLLACEAGEGEAACA